jgi:protein SCO1/2
VNLPFHRLILCTLILCTLFCSCRSHPAAAKRYRFSGRITSIDMQNQSADIDGDAIPAFMDAMTMTYKIKPPATLSLLSPGDSISADLVDIEPDDNGRSDSWLENVKVTGHANIPLPASAAAQHIPAPGDKVPDFSFTNQSGRRISLSQYRGKVLLVTFIYTRCPFPDFCPRMSSNFAEIYKQLPSNPALADVRLLSVSFDPEHDTPKVLRNYGFSVAHTHDPALFSRWEFAVPSAKDLPVIADFFGLTHKPEAGLITHSLSTAVIGLNGKIVSWYHGSDWQISDLIKDATEASPPKSVTTGS